MASIWGAVKAEGASDLDHTHERCVERRYTAHGRLRVEHFTRDAVDKARGRNLALEIARGEIGPRRGHARVEALSHSGH